ncbi:MAG: sulfotransferase [Acetobacteraceae bacterium]|nr:sulfotransferase [Acetobacteraceae bacterium]
MEHRSTVQDEIAEIARKQLFFIGGAPRSGTTWVQQILNFHPEVSCGGEGLFQKHLAEPLDALMTGRRAALETKNAGLFRHTGGYPVPEPGDVEFLLGSAILLALRLQCAGKTCHAIGEKTPENVFLFSRLKQIFPGAKLIAVARDPRDVLTSAWHFFHKPAMDQDETAAKVAFIRLAIPSLDLGARTIVELGRLHPADVMTVTYEALCRTPELVVSNMFRFLKVSDKSDIVADCVARTSFQTQTGGRPAGVEQNGAFFRKGVTGDWRSTLTPAMSDLVSRELGWVFPHFGWRV